MCLGMLRGMSGILTSIGLDLLCSLFFIGRQVNVVVIVMVERTKKSRGLIFLTWFCLKFKGFVFRKPNFHQNCKELTGWENRYYMVYFSHDFKKVGVMFYK